MGRKQSIHGKLVVRTIGSPALGVRVGTSIVTFKTRALSSPSVGVSSLVGGFGAIGWVDVAEYRQASPEPLADDAPGIIEHMNSDHSDALRLLAASASDNAVESAEMTAVDRLGLHLRIKVDGRYRGSWIAFPREVGDPAETRAVMVEMVREARHRAAET